MSDNKLQTANIFVTGGAGTLGRAIAERRKRDGWTGRMTVYSTDTHKHELMRQCYPDVKFIQGDIKDASSLGRAIYGHDVVIHAAAVKVIPTSEYQSIDTIAVNVTGSANVCWAALMAGADVLGISTDKACHPANAYGASKYLMEKIFQEFARAYTAPKFHLVRYGNVLESTGSVIEAWKNAKARGDRITITNLTMTRFWLSPAQAVQYVIDSFGFRSGTIYVPKMPALSVAKLLEYTIGECNTVSIGLRPGEKMHETLLTVEEGQHAFTGFGSGGGYYVVHPTTEEKNPYWVVEKPYSSDVARELTRDELEALLRNE